MPHKDPEARAAYQKAYKAAHRERMKELNQLSYQRNKDGILARRAVVRDSNRERVRERNRAYGAVYRERHQVLLRERARARHAEDPARARRYALTYRTKKRAARVPKPPQRSPDPELVRQQARAKARAYRQRHPDRVKASMLRWVQNHREAVLARYAAKNIKRREQSRRWHVANRERRRLAMRARYAANPLKYRGYALAYLARKRNAVTGPIDYAGIISRDGGRCQICMSTVNKRDISFDHIIPLSLGGPHTQDNLRLTHRSCNSRRGAGRIPAQLLLPVIN